MKTNLKARRVALGLTQKEVADKLDIDEILYRQSYGYKIKCPDCGREV